MPIFRITYVKTTTDDITYETDWICDSNYDCDRAREAFESQFPSAAVVRCQETDC